ncbi:MAG: O-antigen ligase family protein [Methylacidiphilales bacterium]|nr:O-antigen ligase family protein [Candidatus Methylacidiphilales bacterium]
MSRLSHAALYTTAALAPLPFGSNEPLWLVVWIILLAVTLAFADYQRLRPVHLALLAPMLIGAAVYGLVVALQSAALPGLLPDYALHARVGALIGEPQPAPVPTATRELPWLAIGPPVAALMAFLAGFVAATDRDRAARLMRVVAWSCLAYAVYGLLMMVIEPHMLLWREKFSYSGRLSGTFVNPNTAATYFGMGTAIWAALTCDEIRRHLPEEEDDLRDALRLGFSRMPREITLPMIAFLVCFGAVLATGSRAGSLLTLLSVTLVVLLSFRREIRGVTFGLAPLAGAAAIGVAALEVWGGMLEQRLQSGGVVDFSRIELFQSSAAIIADHPWWGTGLGTFATVFPAYRTDQFIYGIADRAHSTPLEVAVEIGLPAAGAIVCACLVTLGLIFRGALTRHRDRAWPIAGAAIGTLVFLHATVDFHLQTAGFFLPFWAVLGAALAQSISSMSAMQRGRSGEGGWEPHPRDMRSAAARPEVALHG